VSKAVRFTRYGGPEVLEIAEVPRPRPGHGQVLVEVVAAALNPGEIGIREGVFATAWPAHFPEGQGNDFAGHVAEVGDGVEGFAVGDRVLGFAPRAAQAEFAVVGPDALAPMPAGLGWAGAASIAGAGATAWAGVEAVAPRRGETVVVSAAAGGVGVIAAQLANLRGATVIGTASEANQDYVRSLGATAVVYGDGLKQRVEAVAPQGIDVVLDGAGGVALKLSLELVKERDRILTLVEHGKAAELGVLVSKSGRSAARLAELAALYAKGDLRFLVRRAYPFSEAAAAHREIETGHGRGKIVLTFP
jgi:NADPH:quinone reductase-like Zn-dependent oxidoreductase